MTGIVRLVLAALLTGLLPLSAQDLVKPGGDGGVVILPAPVALTDQFDPDPGIEHPGVKDPVTVGGGSQSTPPADEVGVAGPAPARLRVSFSLASNDGEDEDEVIRIAIPDEMVNAYAVVLAGEQKVPVPARIVANHLEISLDVLRNLSELSVERLKVLVVSANGLITQMEIFLDSTEEEARVLVF